MLEMHSKSRYNNFIYERVKTIKYGDYLYEKVQIYR